MRPAQLEATMQAWVKRLAAIPTRYLVKVFDETMLKHSTRSPLVPNELLEVWFEIQGRLRAEDETDSAYVEKTCPHWCSVDGWITLDTDGNRPASNYMGYTYTRPCPIHRPHAFKKNLEAAPWCRGPVDGKWPKR